MEEKKINNISSVCVYCASSTKIPSVYFDAAKELGRLLGERKLRVVNGAGNIGLNVRCLRRCVSGWWNGNGRYPPFYGGAGLVS